MPAIFAIFFLLWLTPQPAYAIENPVVYYATISATVPDQTLNPAQLQQPDNNAVTKDTTPEMSWIPGTSNSGIAYEQFYLDNQLFADRIDPNLTTVTTPTYTIHHNNGIHYLTLISSLSDGWHYWKVVTYNSTQTRSVSTDTRQFYVDYTLPLIILNTVEQNQLNWATNIPNSIPIESQRYLVVHTSDPLLTGKVENYANLAISLANQSITLNSTTGEWQHRLRGLLPNVTYAVDMRAIDAASNLTIFPVFYLTYVPQTFLQIIHPTPTPLPISLPLVTPSPPLPILSEPPVATPSTPITAAPILISPTPPPSSAPPPPPSRYPYLSTIIVWGLLLHLAFTALATSTPIRLITQLLFKLFYPFLGGQTFQTRPFTIINIYKPDQLQKRLISTVSDILGFYSIDQTKLPPSVFIKIHKTAHQAPSNILPSSILPYLCLSSNPVSHLNALQRLQIFLMTIRAIPLSVAVFSSLIANFVSFQWWILIYLYLSLQLTYSEYIYPKLSKG